MSGKKYVKKHEIINRIEKAAKGYSVGEGSSTTSFHVVGSTPQRHKDKFHNFCNECGLCITCEECKCDLDFVGIEIKIWADDDEKQDCKTEA